MPKKTESIVSTLMGLVRDTSLVSLDIDGRSRPEEAAPSPEPGQPPKLVIPREPLLSRFQKPVTPAPLETRREAARKEAPKKGAADESYWSPFPDPVTATSRETRCEVEAFVGVLDQVRSTEAYLALPADARASIDRAQHELLTALYCSSDSQRIRVKVDELKQAIAQAVKGEQL